MAAPLTAYHGRFVAHVPQLSTGFRIACARKQGAIRHLEFVNRNPTNQKVGSSTFSGRTTSPQTFFSLFKVWKQT